MKRHNKNHTFTDQALNKSLISKLIYYVYLTLFFVTPLLISLKSTELFEFPKMLFVYCMTGIIFGLWLIDVSISGKLVWKKSWLDLILASVLATQLISSLASLDRYTSFFGYYSRFHGGFISTLCYVMLVLIFKNYASKQWIQDVIMSSLASASIVCLYGIGEHFGIDAHIWVQDVANRVFSTLGQPNWLAAWLGALLPFVYYWFLHPPKSFWPTVITLNTLTIGMSYILVYAITGNTLPTSGTSFVLFILFYTVLNGILMFKAKFLHTQLSFLPKFNFLYLAFLIQLTILFTKSRSGILALVISTFIFLIYEFLQSKKIKTLLPLILASGVLILIIGTEWTPNLGKLLGKNNQIVKNPLTATSSNPTITDSTDIRQVVWKGALAVWQHYPLFGSGTETFAYSYYNFRPQEHNLNSEWDFLYNKAHNEYLNFLANNGIFGITAILALLISSIWLSLKKQLKAWLKIIFFVCGLGAIFYIVKPSLVKLLIHKLVIYPQLIFPLMLASILGLGIIYLAQKLTKINNFENSGFEGAVLAAITSIFITNFYGFSVVTVGILVFMLPVWLIISQGQLQTVELNFQIYSQPNKANWLKMVGSGFAGLTIILTLVFTIQYYQADLAYNYSQSYLQIGDVLEAGKQADVAIQLQSSNANYWLQKGLVDAQTAFVVHYKDASDSSGLVKHYTSSAVNFTQNALLKNPVHVNLYKSAARVYITLGLIDSKYDDFAIKTLEMASKLSPTDPAIPVNIALLLQQQEKYDQAANLYLQAITLKPNYLQAYFLLAQMYEQQNKYPQAAMVYQSVLDKVDIQDGHSKQKLEEFKSKGLI